MAVRIPFINKDMKRIDDNLNIAFFMQDSETERNLKSAVFIGETYLPWTKLLEKPGAWDMLGAALFDPNNLCPVKV
jgi:hypothetical protein